MLENRLLVNSVYTYPRDSISTIKTRPIPVRLSKELISYLGRVVKETNARNISEAIRLIVVERMIEDKERGEISAFSYVPAPTKRDRKKRSGEIKTERPASLPLREAPPIAGPLPAPSGGYNEPVKEAPKGESSSGSDAKRYWRGPANIGEGLSEEELRIMLEQHPEWGRFTDKE